MSLAVEIRDVSAPAKKSERQISNWRFLGDGREFCLNRKSFDEPTYVVSTRSGGDERHRINWTGLLPSPSAAIPSWVSDGVESLRSLALGVRHLQCPRRLIPSPFVARDHPPTALGAEGANTPLALASNEELRKSVRKWYHDAFGTEIDIVAQGSYSELVSHERVRNAQIRLSHSGRGLSHVLPVVATALTAREAGPGLDIIEHPEAELHPAAHAEIAELILNNLPGPARPLVVETHSEVLLLRARRKIAEGKLPSDYVAVYWVSAEPGRGSLLQQIRIDERGEVDTWPDGVFLEDYEEVLAIRRALRERTPSDDAHHD